ncbi:hypothetical protein F5Y06DRAFT_208250 [Hypoxylon sp. FL0890]|nr:hypothetical protein F5Y06DRAFT_208250 [Hypoxylon sp. FL0890]
MPVTLPQLPNEILLNIFSFLRPSLNPKTFWWGKEPRVPPDLITLACLSRTSKHIHELTQPLLYHTIPYCGLSRTRLLRTLVRYPHLAEKFRAIDLNLTNGEGWVFDISLDAVRERLLANNFRGKLEDVVNVPDASCEICLVLSLLPNLELLEITCDYDTNNMVSSFFRKVARPLVNAPEKQNGQKHPFTQLQEVRLCHSDTHDAQEATSIFLVDDILLPTVHTLRGWSISWEVHPNMSHISQTQLNLKHIYLTYSFCNAEGLVNLLSRCPDLRTLQIEWHEPTAGGSDELNFDKMGEALRNHAHNLEKLVLLYWCGGGFAYARRGRIGSLRKLSCLKALTLQQDILVGEVEDSDKESSGTGIPPLSTLYEVLPDSLEKLRLYSYSLYPCQDDDEENLDEQVYDLIASNQMKNLRKVRVDRENDSFRNSFYKDVKKFVWKASKTHGMMLVTKQETETRTGLNLPTICRRFQCRR